MAGNRQLAAIMCTDIDGYADLIQHDASKAAELKERHREILHRVVLKFHGKILQNIGHDSLSLFSSAVEAVRCAIDMQIAFREEPIVPVKVGIHLGDIIFTEEEAIGDGIIIARKIETQSLPGGILISNKIYEEVKKQPGIETRYIKACDLDEQDQQVEVYAITNEGIKAPEGIPEADLSDKEVINAGSGLRYFWEEAKRRNVVRVIAMYAGAVYVIIELVNNVVDPLGLPQWLPTVVILLLIVGFPVTAILSWIFDFTPEGIKKTVPVEELEPVERDAQTTSDKSWFARNKIFRRYLVPLLVVVLKTAFSRIGSV
jgi:class 3 adenylate cyclase